MRLSVALLVGALLIWNVCCEPKVIYKTTNLECFTVPKLSTNASCILKAINWNMAVAQMDVYFLQPVNNMTVRIKVFKQDYSNKYHPFLVDVLVNLCDIIGRRNHSPYGKYMWNLIKRYTNFNHSCPFVGHMFARDLFIDESVVPIKLPLGYYQVSLTSFENYRDKPPLCLGTIKLYAQSMIPVTSKRNRTKPMNRTNIQDTLQTAIIPIQIGN
ncbi:uncharacterized protein LOC108159854 [Drosophila miranda]|uniref:uncharacterized protein LOC108159854 n=1 Tax=Drosophila miranda TaxID=7229 RepID=UPI0007E6F283|nr:uncharacterized protein LOC108159854 [Drosophila miranda]